MSHPAPDPRLPAALALALDGTPPPGPPPDLATLEHWRNGTLPPARAAAVRARLARDPALFAQLVELETAADLAHRLAPPDCVAPDRVSRIPECQPRPGPLARLRRRLTPRPGSAPWLWGGGLATAALLTGLALLVLPRLTPPPAGPDLASAPAAPGLSAGLHTGLRAGLDRDLARLGRGSGTTAPADRRPATATPWPETTADDGARLASRERAFREGVRQARLAAAGPWAGKDLAPSAAALPDSAAADAACRARSAAYRRLGRWAWDLDAACRDGPPSAPAAARTLAQLAADLGPDEPLAATLTAAARSDDPHRLCATAARLLAPGTAQ